MKGFVLAGLLAVQAAAHPGHDRHGDNHFYDQDGHHPHEEERHGDHFDGPRFGRSSPPHPPTVMTLEARLSSSGGAADPMPIGYHGVWPDMVKREPAVWAGEEPVSWSSVQSSDPVAPQPVGLRELHDGFHAALKAAQEACVEEFATFCADPSTAMFPSDDFTLSSEPSFTVTTDVSSGLVAIAAPQGGYAYDSSATSQIGSYMNSAATQGATLGTAQYYTVVDSADGAYMAVDPLPEGSSVAAAEPAWPVQNVKVMDSLGNILDLPFAQLRPLPRSEVFGVPEEEKFQVLRAETEASPQIWTWSSSTSEPDSGSTAGGAPLTSSAVWVSIQTMRSSFISSTTFSSSSSARSVTGFPSGRMVSGCTHGVRGGLGGFGFAAAGGYRGSKAPMPLGFGSHEADACMMAHLASASDQCQAAVVTAAIAGAQLHDAQEIADEMWSRSAGAAALNVLAAAVVGLFVASVVAAKRRRKILREVESWWAAVHRNPDVRGAVERKVGEEVPPPARLARPLFCVVLGTLINGFVLLVFVVMPLLIASDRLARGGPNGEERQAMVAEDMEFDEDMDDLFECPIVPLLLVGLTIAAFVSVKRRHRLAKKIFKMWRVIHADEVLRAAVEAEADKPMPRPPQRMPGRCMFKVAMRLVRLAVVLAGFAVFVTLGHVLLGGYGDHHHHNDSHHGHHHPSGEYPPSPPGLAATALWWGLLTLVFVGIYRAVRRNNNAAARNNGSAPQYAAVVASAVTGTGTQTPPGDDNSAAPPGEASASTVVVVGTPMNPPPNAGGYVPPVVPATQVETAIV